MANNGYTLYYKTNDKKNDNKKKWLIGGVHILGYGSSVYALSSVWYKNFDQTKFHTFNDIDEWGGMDKFGHLNTSWQIANASNKMFVYSGFSQKKSALLSSSFALFYLTTLECFDGLSADWGFSIGDMGANFAGTTLAYLKNRGLINNVAFKFGWTNSIYAKYRPEVLGSNFPEKILKDYNAQTYWLSLNLPKKIFADSSQNWLCLSIGYSIDGFTGGKQNYFDPTLVNPPSFNRVGEFYLSVDIDFTKLNIKSKFLKNVLRVFNIIKIPAPAIGIDTRGKLMIKALYF